MIVRQKLLTKLVSLWNEDKLTVDADRVPIEFVPRTSQHSGRCCIHKKRAVLKYKSLPLMGYDMTDTSLTKAEKKKLRNCFSYEVYKNTEQLATQLKCMVNFLEDATQLTAGL